MTNKITNTMNITLSSKFKKKASKAIASIIAFILLYLLLLLIAILFTALCFVGGGLLILVFHNFFTIVLGIGLASLGFIILAFFLKFLFKKYKADISHLDEISRKNHPKLFSLIDEIVVDTQTQFPRKVYLSQDLNAGVFYNSSFWSMFFPVRKNLYIGLALINTVTEQELKAILAHEFGHFSQRSMSIGSYVYYVNQVIYNMLYDNDSFDQKIQGWASASGYFSVVTIIAVKIIRLIQWLLQKMYSFVNICYLALSREMEFHADEVAANVAGSKALENALLRLDLSQQAYNETLKFYGEKIESNIRSKNIYKDHLYVLNLLGRKNNILIKNNLPYITLSETDRFQISRLNIAEQWSTHPTTKERVLALENLNIEKEKKGENPAMDLLGNADNICESYTDQLFANAGYNRAITILSSEESQDEINKYIYQYTFPSEYNGYYDNKSPDYFDVENITSFDNKNAFDTFFDKDKTELILTLGTLRYDEDILKSILNKEISVKNFSYDGRKYKVADTDIVMTEVQKEIASLKDSIIENDINIYNFFYNEAMKRGLENDLKNAYIEFFNQDKIYENRINLYNEFVNATNFLRVETSHQYYQTYFRILSNIEIKLKAEIKNLMVTANTEKEITDEIRNSFDNYLSRNWSYAANETSDQEYLEVLFTAANNYNYIVARSYFIERQNLLNYQISILKK